jgi:hypothetical protein
LIEITTGFCHEKRYAEAKMPRKVISVEQRKREGAVLKLLWERYLEQSRRTQTSVVEELGINPGQPSNWFNGIKPIPVPKLLKQAQLMGFDPRIVRPQLEEELDMWLTTYKPAIDSALEKRIRSLDTEGRRLVETAVELAEARQRAR